MINDNEIVIPETKQLVELHCTRVKFKVSDTAKEELVKNYDYVCTAIINDAQKIALKSKEGISIEPSHVKKATNRLFSEKASSVVADMGLFISALGLGRSLEPIIKQFFVDTNNGQKVVAMTDTDGIILIISLIFAVLAFGYKFFHR